MAETSQTVGQRTRELVAAGVPIERVEDLFKKQTGKNLRDIPQDWPMTHVKAKLFPEDVQGPQIPAPATPVGLSGSVGETTATAPAAAPYKNVLAPTAKIGGMLKGAAEAVGDIAAEGLGGIVGAGTEWLAGMDPRSTIAPTTTKEGVLQKAAKERKKEIEEKAKQPFVKALAKDVTTTLSAIPAAAALAAEGVLWPANIPADADPGTYLEQQGKEFGRAVTIGVPTVVASTYRHPIESFQAEPLQTALSLVPEARAVGMLADAAGVGTQLQRAAKAAKASAPAQAIARKVEPILATARENLADPVARMLVDSTYSSVPRKSELLQEVLHRPDEVAAGVKKVLLRDVPQKPERFVSEHEVLPRAQAARDKAQALVTELEAETAAAYLGAKHSGTPQSTALHARKQHELAQAKEVLAKSEVPEATVTLEGRTTAPQDIDTGALETLPDIEFRSTAAPAPPTRTLPDGTQVPVLRVQPARTARNPYKDIAEDVVGPTTAHDRQNPRARDVRVESVVAEINHVLEDALDTNDLLRVPEIRQKVVEYLSRQSQGWGAQWQGKPIHKAEVLNKYLDAVTTFNPNTVQKIPGFQLMPGMMQEALDFAVTETTSKKVSTRQLVVEATAQRLAKVAQEKKVAHALKAESATLEDFLRGEEAAYQLRMDVAAGTVPADRAALRGTNNAPVPRPENALVLEGDITTQLERLSQARREAYTEGLKLQREQAGLPPVATATPAPAVDVPPRGPIPPSARRDPLERAAAGSLDPAGNLQKMRALRDRAAAAPDAEAAKPIIQELAELQTTMRAEEKAFRETLAQQKQSAEAALASARSAGDVAAEQAAIAAVERYGRAKEIGDLYRKIQDFKKLDESITGIADTWVDPVVHHAITAHARAQQALQHVTGAGVALSLVKKNLTARNIVSALNNVGSNLLLQALRTGDPLGGGTEAVRAFQEYRKLMQWSKGQLDNLTPEQAQLAEKWRALAKTGVFDATQLDKDFGISQPWKPSEVAAAAYKSVTGKKAGPAGPIGKTADVVKGASDWATKKFEEVYRFGDNFFKAGEASKEFDRIAKLLEGLQDGEHIMLPNQSGTTSELSRARGGFRLNNKPLKAEELTKLVADAAAKSANDIFFDYGKVPGYAEILRYQPMLGLLSPFFTWSVKSIDLPGKAGLGTRTVMGRPAYATNSAKALRAQAWDQVKLGASRNMLLGGLRSALEDQQSPELLEKIRYYPNDLKLGLARLASNPEFVEVAKMGNWNYLNSTMDVIRLASAGLGFSDVDPSEGGTLRTTSDEELLADMKRDEAALQQQAVIDRPATFKKISQRLSDTKAQLAIPQVDRKTAVAKMFQGTGQAGSLREWSTLLGMSGGPLADLVAVGLKDQASGQDVQVDDLLKQFGAALVGGTYAKGIEAGTRLLAGPGTRWSREQFAQSAETREDTFRFLLRKLTGMGWMRIHPKDTEEYFTRMQSEWKARLGIPKLKKEVESLLLQGKDAEADALGSQVGRLETIVEEELSHMQDDYYKMKEVLGARQDERKGADKF